MKFSFLAASRIGFLLVFILLVLFFTRLNHPHRECVFADEIATNENLGSRDQIAILETNTPDRISDTVVLSTPSNPRSQTTPVNISNTDLGLKSGSVPADPGIGPDSAPADPDILEPLQLSRHPKYLAAMIQENQDIVSTLPASGFLKGYKNFCWWDSKRQFRCTPAVYLAGFIKCGTTDLYSKLIWHEELLKPPAGKENMYWPRSRIGRYIGLYQHGHRPRESFEIYTNRVTPPDMSENPEAMVIDGTPCLVSELIEWEQRYPWASHPPYTNADIIRFTSPNAKVIVMVRDPVERLWSDFLYFDRGQVRTPAMFAREIIEEINRFNTCLESRDLRYCCYSDANSLRIELNIGIYICYIQDWLENFGDNLFVLTLEEYHENTKETLFEVFDFIGVRVDREKLETFLKSSETLNQRRENAVKQGNMLEETREILQNFYRPYNLMLARYLQNKKYKWGY